MMLQIIHIIANILRIWSVYSMYRYLSQTGASVTLFIFCCLVPSPFIFWLLQKPWRGRPLLNTQMVFSVINGGITALYFILWGKGIKSCGPVRAILAEYSGAVLGVLSVGLYGQRGHLWKKTELLGMKIMVLPIFAGILSALRRVIGRCVSVKGLHAITIASATCFLFPVAMWDIIIGSKSSSGTELPFSAWAFLSTTLFGVILIFYVDSMAEERLHMVFSSPMHLMVAGGCIIVMETAYNTDFSLLGFGICSSILGFGVYEATSLDRSRRIRTTSTDSETKFLCLLAAVGICTTTSSDFLTTFTRLRRLAAVKLRLAAAEQRLADDQLYLADALLPRGLDKGGLAAAKLRLVAAKQDLADAELLWVLGEGDLPPADLLWVLAVGDLAPGERALAAAEQALAVAEFILAIPK